MPAPLGTNRLSEDKLRQHLSDLGLTLVSPYSDYKTQHSKLRYIARCGHENVASLAHLRTGRGLYCKKCAFRVRTLRHNQSSIDMVVKTLKDSGCVLVTPKAEDIVLGGKITFVPRCGHGTRTTTCGNFMTMAKNGPVECKACALARHNRKIQYSEADVEHILADKGCEYIKGSYINSESPVSYIAKCGHPEREIFSYVRRSCYDGLCKNCRTELKKSVGKENLLRACERLGCKLKKYVGSTANNVVVGTCGHEFTTTAYKLINHATGECPLCGKQTSELLVYKLMTDIFGSSCIHGFRIHDSWPYQYIDVVVPRVKLAVEYNGDQHYKRVNVFHRTEDEFKTQLERDARKRVWCKDNGYMLVELDGRKHSTLYGNITTEWITSEIERQTGMILEVLVGMEHNENTSCLEEHC